MLFKKKTPITKIKWHLASMPPETLKPFGEVNFVLMYIRTGHSYDTRIGYYDISSERWVDGFSGRRIEYFLPDAKVVYWASIPKNISL